MSSSRSDRRMATVLASLSWFVNEEGLVDSWPLEPELLEAFCATTRRSWATSTRGTYRSVLRRAGGLRQARDEALLMAGRRRLPLIRAPNAANCGRWPLRNGRSGAARAPSCSSHWVSGRGCGRARSPRPPAPTCGAEGGDGARRGGDHVAHRSGARPVFRLLAWGDGPRGPERHLFHPGEADRSYHNFVNGFCRNLVADPAAPSCRRPGAARASSVTTWPGTDLSVLLALTGIKEVESLLRYARHGVVPPSPRPPAECWRSSER